MTPAESTSTLSAVAGSWDCVVIGGGPAGALAARQTAQLGFSTLVVERKSFPRSQVCGACLNHRARLGVAVVASYPGMTNAIVDQLNLEPSG